MAIAARPNDNHLNPSGTVHCERAATLLEGCMGLHHPVDAGRGIGSTTLEIKISFVRANTPETGVITAEGTGAQLRPSGRHGRRKGHPLREALSEMAPQR